MGFKQDLVGMFEYVIDPMRENYKNHGSLYFNWPKKKPNNIKYHHFKPYTFWKIVPNKSKSSNSESLYLIDPSTGEKYLNDDLVVVWLKCFGVVLATPFVHLIASIIEFSINLLKFMTLYNFWKKDLAYAGSYHFSDRLVDTAANLVNMIWAPIAFVSLELSAVYGLFSPRTGRKLFATYERLIYGDSCMAPCFQPDPTKHLFNGDINIRNAW